MGIYDGATGDVSNVGYSADISASLADEPSIFGSVGNFITKGVPLTGLSIINSFVNTGISFANMFGANIEQLKVQDEMDAMGASSYGDYYAAHQQGIEAAGLVIGSFIPGMAGVKAVRAMQSGKLGGEIASRATNLLMPASDAVMARTLQTIKTESSLFNLMSTDTVKAISLGFRDQAVQALAFETATYATMNQSPLISDDSWGNIAHDAALGVFFGGGLGGIIEGFSTYGKFRRAINEVDFLAKAQEVFKNTGQENKSIFDGNSLGADKALFVMNSLYEMPEPLINLGIFRRTETVKRGEIIFKQTLQDTFSSNEQTKPFIDAFADSLIEARRSGVVKQDLEDRLARLVSVGPINGTDVVPTTDFFYLHNFLSAKARESLAVGGREPNMSDMFTNAPAPEADISRAFKLRPFASSPSIASFVQTFEHPITGEAVPLFKNAEEAFRAGNDIYINSNNKIVANPKMLNIQEIPLPGNSRVLTQKEYKLWKANGTLPADAALLKSAPVYMELGSGNLSTTVIPVAGDLGAVKVTPGGVSYGIGRNSVMNKEAATLPLTPETDTLTASARYLWASDRGIRTAQEVVEGDIPMLDAIYQQGLKYKGGWEKWTELLEKRGITLAERDMPETPADMLQLLTEQKNNYLAEVLVTKPATDAGELAIKANVSKDYISNQFTATNINQMSPDIERFGRPNTVKLQYNIGNALFDQGNIVRGVKDAELRDQLVRDTQRAAMANYFKKDSEKFLADKFTTADASVQPDAPGLVTFANGAYGSFMERVQGIGRNLQNWVKDKNTQDLSILSPMAGPIRSSKEAATEASLIFHTLRSTPYSYTRVPMGIIQANFPGAKNPEGVYALTKALIYNKQGEIIGFNRGFVPEGFKPGLVKADIVDELTEGQKGFRTFYETSPEVSDLFNAHIDLTNQRNIGRNNWYKALGINRSLPQDTLYAPPIDVSKNPYVATVVPKKGMAFADDSVSVIAAASDRELQRKILAIDHTQFDVYTKDQTKLFHEVQGDYDSQRNFNTGQANAEMQRKGIFNNFIPNTDAENLLADIQTWHSKQNLRLSRDYVEMGNSRLIAELKDMGDKIQSISTSRTNWWSSLEAKAAPNPYQKYIDIMLNIKDEHYKLWTDANEKAQAFADGAFRSVRNAFMGAANRLMPLEEVSKVAERMGLGNPYAAAVNQLKMHTEIVNQLPPTNVLSRAVSMINGLQAATGIRLDTFQTLINVVSNPIMTLTEAGSVKKALASVRLPGTEIDMPSNFKLLYMASKDWHDPDIRAKWMPLLEENGIIQKDTREYFRMQDEMTIPLGAAFHESEWLKKLEDWTDKAAAFTGSKWGENYVRFTTAMVARRVFELEGLQGLELMDRVSTFVSRVHGNYVAAQRPVAFQGPIGQAASLFQTYQLGLLQNLTRYVTNGEARTLATFAGLQATMYGIQGLPGIQTLNQYLIGDAASNPAHKDIYSQMTNYMDKGMADWFLYGGVSNVLGMGLYPRGDINPRHLTIIPINPLEFPAISGQISFWGNLFKTVGQIANGGAIWNTLMQGLEHNSMSRPLAGLAQLMQGYSTTSGGNIIQKINLPGSDDIDGWVDVRSLANFGRILGSKPLDEAITMDANFRKTAYEANDQTKLKAIGAAARSQLVGNRGMDEDTLNSFVARYAGSGGVVQNFNREIMDWQKSANVSVANSIFQHLGKPLNQQMMLQMGGMPLPDYTVPNPARQQVPLTTGPQIAP